MDVTKYIKRVRNKICMIMARINSLTDKNLILQHTGYIECDFGPDLFDVCDECKTVNIQLYFGDRDVWDNRDGCYKCIRCLRKQYMADMEQKFSER